MLLIIAAVLVAFGLALWLARRLDRDNQATVYPCCWATVGGPHYLSCDTVTPAEAAARIAAANPHRSEAES